MEQETGGQARAQAAFKQKEPPPLGLEAGGLGSAVPPEDGDILGSWAALPFGLA